MKEEMNDLKAEQTCMTECISAFTKLSRHYCALNCCDSVAVDQAEWARVRVYNWLAAYLKDHKYL